MSTHSELIICFYRETSFSEDTKFIYIKQNPLNGEYAVKFKTQNNKATVYSTTQFFVTALSTMTLLMAEYGIGCQWKKL